MNKAIQRGLTLLEIVVTLAVSLVILAVAAPNFTNFVKSNRLTTVVNDLIYSLNLARSEALKTGGASICPSQDMLTCASDNTWNQGWIVFTDPNGNCQPDTSESVVRVFEPLPTVIDPIPQDCVSYSGEGFLRSNATPVFRVRDDRTGLTVGRNIEISPTGRTNVSNAACL